KKQSTARRLRGDRRSTWCVDCERLTALWVFACDREMFVKRQEISNLRSQISNEIVCDRLNLRSGIRDLKCSLQVPDKPSTKHEAQSSGVKSNQHETQC